MRSIVRLAILALYSSGLLGSDGFGQTATLRPDRFLKESDFMQFISVEPQEIRVELIANCETLVEHLEIELDDASIITPKEQESLIKEATQYFSQHFTFFLEGVPVSAARVSGDILRLGATDSVVKERLVEEKLSEAVLGIAYTYPLDGIISSFELSWNRLPAKAKRIPVQISTPDGIQNFEFSEFFLILDWSVKKEVFQLPKLKAVPVHEKTWLGRPKLDEKLAAAILTRLITNIYLAFEYPTEPAIYDGLAKSLVGDELSAIYLKYRKRIESISRGGPKVKILKVSIDEIRSIRRDKENFVLDASWRVFGKVRHFGHIHERLNRYQATLTLTTDQDAWKLRNIEILKESRLR